MSEICVLNLYYKLLKFLYDSMKCLDHSLTDHRITGGREEYYLKGIKFCGFRGFRSFWTYPRINPAKNPNLLHPRN